MQRGDAPHVAQYLLPHVEAGTERSCHRQIKQHTSEHAVLVVEADITRTTDQVGAVFRVGQPARSLGGGATIGQGEHRGAKGCARRGRIGVNRNEQVGAFLAGDFRTLAQRDEVIAGAGQLSTETFFAVDLTLQFFGDLQHDVFLVLATRAGSARVFAAMPGIDSNHDVTLATGYRGQLDRRLGRRHWHRRRGRRRLHRCPCRRWRAGRDSVSFLVIQIDHQAVAVLCIGRQGEAFRGYRLFQVDHNPKVGWRTLGRTHIAYRRVGGSHIQWRGQCCAIDVDDQTIGCAQGEDTVLHGARQVENQPRVVRCAPQAHALDLSDGQSVNGHRCQQQPNDGDQCAYAHTYPTYCL